MKVNAEFIKKWIGALVSGDYAQGREALKSHDKRYCCLGVACEVAGRKSKFIPVYGLYKFGAETVNISFRFQKTIGLTDEDVSTLIVMNDNQKKSFKEIATWLRKRFKKELAK